MADVVTAYWGIHVSPGHVEQTASVTNRSKHYFNLMPFDVCLQRSLAFCRKNLNDLGHVSEVLIYIDDLRVMSLAWERHINSLEKLFAALQTAGLTLKPS